MPKTALFSFRTMAEIRRSKQPRVFTRRDARTLALFLVYGKQSNLTNEIQDANPATPIIDKSDRAAKRREVQAALLKSNWPEAKRQRLLSDFDKRHTPAQAQGDLA